jgi:uncharacterized Fe-S center protein
VSIAYGFFGADAIIGVGHFKGHELSGVGGSLKNLAMCCSSRGKIEAILKHGPKGKKSSLY